MAIGSLWESYLTLCAFGSIWLLSFKVVLNSVAGGSGLEHAPSVKEVRGSSPRVNRYFGFGFEIVQSKGIHQKV